MKNLIFGFLAVVLFSCSSVAQTDSRPGPSLYVQSDLVDAVAGCYTVNVRVYSSDGFATYLVSSTNVKVGECGRMVATNLNSECKDEEYKGDFFLYTKDKYPQCALDLFKKDEVLYAKYIIEKNRVIDDYKEKNTK
ncbi:hypothetical protein [Flavobacterium sp. 25HG05S-40]|uniref:hypothetical protein n=1 Tax=Flavobacterium sp. 25HG05S-40 TaxID=3458682 RepID=UPI004044FCD9